MSCTLENNKTTSLSWLVVSFHDFVNTYLYALQFFCQRNNARLC